MARRIVGQLVRQGYTDSQILGIFRNPISGGLCSFYRSRGEEWMQGLVAQVREGVV